MNHYCSCGECMRCSCGENPAHCQNCCHFLSPEQLEKSLELDESEEK